MANLQHRRSISTTAIVYARLQAHCARQGVSVSSFVQSLVTSALDREGEPVPVIAPAGYPRRRRETTDAQARELANRGAAHFTF
jgi:hypothetical protein